jgi:hypothetical protein
VLLLLLLLLLSVLLLTSSHKYSIAAFDNLTIATICLAIFSL